MSDLSEITAVFLLLIVLGVIIILPYFVLKKRKQRAKLKPLELLQEISFTEPQETFLCSYVKFKLNSYNIVVKNSNDDLLGTLDLKFLDVGSKITLRDEIFPIKFEAATSQFSIRHLFRIREDGSEVKVATSSHNHHDYLGENKITFEDGREILIVRSDFKSYLKREFTIKENGDRIGRIMGKDYIIYSFLTSNIPDYIKLFIVMTKQLEAANWFNNLK